MEQIIGPKLRAWRKAQRRSIEHLARELGISYVTLQRWETNKLKTGASALGRQALSKAGYQE